MSLIFVYITVPTESEARKIASHLIGKKLAACAVISGSVNSIYPWKGKIANEKEFILLCKTHSGKFNSIAKEVEKIHSYEIPCIIKIPVSANKKYEKWVNDCLK